MCFQTTQIHTDSYTPMRTFSPIAKGKQGQEHMQLLHTRWPKVSIEVRIKMVHRSSGEDRS